jgi:hypothetical protein
LSIGLSFITAGNAKSDIAGVFAGLFLNAIKLEENKFTLRLTILHKIAKIKC